MATSAPLVNIVETHDVVFAEIAAGLDLNQLQLDLAGILQPVDSANRDIDRFVLMHDFDQFVDSHLRRAAHHDPVFGAVKMLLQREPAARLHDNALDLIARPRVDALIVAPRAVGALVFGRLGAPFGLELIEVQTGSYLGEDDIVRIEDVYNRS